MLLPPRRHCVGGPVRPHQKVSLCLASPGVHDAQSFPEPVSFGGGSRQHSVVGDQVVDLPSHLHPSARSPE